MSDTTKYSFDIPVNECQSDFGCIEFEHNRMLINRLQTVNDILTRRESTLIRENQILTERLRELHENFLQVKMRIDQLQESVNVLRHDLKNPNGATYGQVAPF